ncbi:hypothetical protein Q5H92_01955 [Hymenobacter sp. M29]|uniref:Knr4/Smi1-like domain-containing protein n=1 Tax=Hymenobacter mellowenesis TaxID=3063995 RepID=A0ABT9A6F4_9BACT|nr:hypothetical protein [Hymenobacter sp. M29]MDO7845103.1 hypothetical protein [Hymenobacter sp. M29]
MNQDHISYVIDCLKANGVQFDAGLTTVEVQQIEQTFSFCFPPDLRAFLQAALPTSKEFVPWRRGIRSMGIARKIIKRIHQPKNELLFDVREGTFWRPEWGSRPSDKEQREEIARQHLSGCPQLIPIYGHRYLPELPHEAGNPVFSVRGYDTIYYGYDLLTYFAHEFNLRYPLDSQPTKKPKHIEFWGDFDEPKDITTWGYWDGTEAEDY